MPTKQNFTYSELHHIDRWAHQELVWQSVVFNVIHDIPEVAFEHKLSYVLEEFADGILNEIPIIHLSLQTSLSECADSFLDGL